MGIYITYIIIKNKVFLTQYRRVGDDGVPAILQYMSYDLYLTDRKETMAILQKGTHTPLHICKQGLPSFIIFSHKIKYSYKCILMLRATHGHYGGSTENIILRQAHGSGLWAARPPCMFGGPCVLPQRFLYCKRSVRH